MKPLAVVRSSRMDVSDLRRRILRALDEAKNDAALRRTEVDASQRAYEEFLEQVAVPVLRQTQLVLKAEGHGFTVHAPAGSARIVSDTAMETFLEFVLDQSGERPLILGRTSRQRGRGRVVIDERPVVTDRPIASVTDEDVAAFLVAELPRLVKR
jgi:hypothetical protein